MRTRTALFLLAMLFMALMPASALADHDIVVGFDDVGEIPDGETEPIGPWDGFVDARDDADRTDLIRGFVSNGVRVTIPAYTHRGIGGILRMDPNTDEGWYRYYLRLDQWNATSSGKLPGLSGLYSTSGRGCIPSSEASPGWSARTMFEATGTEGAGDGEVRLGTYLYHLDQGGTCGDQILWQPGVIQQDRWYCIEGHVRMNTPGQNDGLVDAWVDRVPTLRWPDVAFRRVGEEDIGVRHLWANIYFGGTVVNPTDLRVSIDEIEFSHTGRIGCIDPFTDDNTSIHEPDLDELYTRGVLFGCGDRLACPRATITRGEMAALLARALALASGPAVFSDVGGHFAEADIGALAAAGITRGCTSTRFCPDEPVTRGQMAAFLTRAFDLTPGEDAFFDDDGHWAEASIDALAASGITKGCDDDAYCPDALVTREQMATFLRRALGYELPPATVGYASAERVGILVEGGFGDDTGEPAPVLD